MGVINPANTITFTTTDNLFARIRKRLNSYDAAGLLDEGDFYYYIKEIMERLGVSVYEEQRAILNVYNFKVALPENFSSLHAAYKCKSSTTNTQSKNTVYPQTGFVFYLEETHEPYRKCSNCHAAKIDYIEGDKVTVRTYIEGAPQTFNYSSPTLLSIISNVSGGSCAPDCKNLSSNSPHQIAINNGFIHTNFDDEAILLYYYAMAIDPESGLPKIPSNTFIEKAVEDYTVYRIMEDIFINSTAPDMEKKYQLARANSDDSMKAALYYVKLPSFQTAINLIRFNRKNLDIYQQTDF